MLYYLKEVGAISLSTFWFPLVIWTALVIAVLPVMKYSKKIHAIYQYHIRAAMLLALPVGLTASFAISRLLSAFSADPELTAKFIVIQSPVIVPATGISQAVSWSDPIFWAGLAVTFFALVSAVFLVKFTADLIVLRRFSSTLYKSLLSELPLLSAHNLNLAENVTSDPVIAFTDEVQVPFTFGWLNTTVVLPDALKGTPEKLNLALRHELMHIKHRDYLLNNLLILVKALFWFHPLVHYLYNDFKEYREISCDSEVLADSTISRKSYAELLFELAPKNVFPNSRTVSMAVNPSTLKKRIHAMTHQPYSNKIFRSSIIAAVVSALSITGVIACSDVQNTGITNQDVAEAQHSIITTETGEQPLYVINGEQMDLEESGDIISRIKPKYIKTIAVLKGKQAVDKYGQAGRNGVIQLQLLDKEKAFSDLMDAPPPPPLPNTAPHSDDTSIQSTTPPESYFLVVEEMPQLIGGLESLQKHIRYPDLAHRAGIEGRVIVQFIVNEQGRVEDPQIIRGIGGGCDEEALRAVSEARFKPGRQRGKAVRVQYSLPVIFKLASTDDMSSWKPASREAGDPSNISVGEPSVITKKFILKDVSNNGSGVISGTLIDTDTGKPLPGANIVITGTTTGTTTDIDGEFRLHDVPPGDHDISVSYIGYEMANIHVAVK